MTKKIALITGITGQDGSYPRNYSPTEVETVLGEPTKAKEKLAGFQAYVHH